MVRLTDGHTQMCNAEQVSKDEPVQTLSSANGMKSCSKPTLHWHKDWHNTDRNILCHPSLMQVKRACVVTWPSNSQALIRVKTLDSALYDYHSCLLLGLCLGQNPAIQYLSQLKLPVILLWYCKQGDLKLFIDLFWLAICCSIFFVSADTVTWLQGFQ